MFKNFNPRSPWGERRTLTLSSRMTLYFNPRSPWGERLVGCSADLTGLSFQSTLPVGGATKSKKYCGAYQHISIHAPRGGSDILKVRSLTNKLGFQSTLPVGGATPEDIPPEYA